MFKLTIQDCNKSPRPFVMSRDRGRLGLTDTKYHETYQMAGFYPGLSNLICSAGGLCRRFACPEEWRRSSTPKTPAARPPALPGIAECAFGASAGREAGLTATACRCPSSLPAGTASEPSFVFARFPLVSPPLSGPPPAGLPVPPDSDRKSTRL